jgi:hypothetical protein
MTTPSSTPLLCRLNVKHHWVMQSTEDGARFKRCTRCGKDKYDGGRGSGDWAAPAGM